MPRPNIYGIETEQTVQVEFLGDKSFEVVGGCHDPDVGLLGLYSSQKESGSNKLLRMDIDQALEHLGIFRNGADMLSNGARLYGDVSGLEYATPETTTAEKAVLRTFDGDSVLYGVFRFLEYQGVINSFQLNRRVVDHNRSSRGVHLNTLADTDLDIHSDLVRENLVALNIAKGAMFGSGGLLLASDGTTQFHHSPRLSVTDSKAAHYNTEAAKRPLLRYPIKYDGSMHARIEHITSDALNFGWPLRASLVMSNTLVRLLERNIVVMPLVHTPVMVAEGVGRLGHEARYKVSNFEGVKTVGPVDMLRHLAETALEEHINEPFLDSESVQVLGEVIEVADKMKIDPDLVATQVESVARHQFIMRRMEVRKAEIDSEVICRADYAWDMIGANGVAALLRERGVGMQGFTKQTPAQKKQEMMQPPQDTRAKLRGRLIVDSKGGNRSGNKGWGWMSVLVAGKQEYFFCDPHDNGDSIAEEYLR